MATYADIGRATKAKYPAYEGKSDEEVGRAVVQKYPEYKSRLDTNSPVQNIASYLGLKTALDNTGAIAATPMINKHTDEFAKSSQEAYKASNSLIQLAKKETDPVRKKALLDQSRSIMDGVNQKSQEFSRNLTKLQETAGITEKDLGRSNLEFAARRGAGQTAELAAWLLPGMVGGKAASVGGRVLQAAERGAVAGGLQGAAGAAKDSENVLDAVKRLATGTAIGAGTGVALQGVLETPQMAREFWSGTAKSLTPKAKEVYASTLKQNVSDRKFYKQYGGVDKVIDDASAFKLPNTKNGMVKAMEEYKPEYEKLVAETLNKPANSKKTVNLAEAVKRAKSIVKSEYGSDQTVIDAADNWFKANSKIYGGETSLSGANKLRQGLDRVVGSVLATDISQGSTAAKKALVTVLREEFKSKVPELRMPIRKYHLMSGLLEAMKVEPMASLPELTGAAAGSAIGAINGGPTAVLGALLGLGGSVVARSPGIKRSVSNAVINAGRRTVQAGTTKVAPGFIINPAIAALQRAIDNETKAKQTRTVLP